MDSIEYYNTRIANSIIIIDVNQSSTVCNYSIRDYIKIKLKFIHFQGHWVFCFLLVQFHSDLLFLYANHAETDRDQCDNNGSKHGSTHNSNEYVQVYT